MSDTTVVTSQTDFSAGEIDVAAKRDNKNPLVLAGVRQATNFRILNTKGMANRPGRRALFAANARVEEVLMAPGVTYYFNFANLAFKIFDATGTQVFTEVRTWTTATAKNVVWAVYDKSLYVTFAGMTPRIYTWDGATTWTAADFAEQVIGNQKRTLFYRIAAKGITLTPGAASGNGVAITFSAAVLVAGMIGTRIRYGGRQMQIATVTNGTTGTADIKEPLQGAQLLTFSVANPYVVGDSLSEFVNGTGVPTGAFGAVTAVAGSTATVTLGSTLAFTGNSTTYVATGGVFRLITTVANVAPPASAIWDQEVMNAYQGWPQSVFVDQNRLGFCDFPAVPAGIAWSAVTNFSDFYPDAFAADGLATDCIFEIVQGKRRVLYVIPGMDASEFVFCDRGLLYVQITPANPLRPGSVGFNTISEDECAQIQPRRAGEFILFVTGGSNQVMAVRIYGAYTRAYKVDGVTEMSAHLFTSITAIAIMTASASFAERYCFILNSDGSVIVGKFTLDKNDQLDGVIGWTPWTGGGTIKWVACKGANILFTTSYAPNAIAAVQVAEILDDTQYLDAAQLYNTQPSGLPIPGGKGPLWWIANGTVDLMEIGARPVNLSTVNTIGNMTANGGLAAAFNGAYVQAQAAGAGRAAADGYVGLNYTARQIVGGFLVWPSSDQGFAVGGSGNVTLDLYGNTALPASATDGTLLKTVNIADQTTGPVAVIPDYNVTGYQYVWLRNRQTGASAVCIGQIVPLTGPLWWLNGGQIQVGGRMMGTYAVDANGFLVAQGVAGEDLTSATLVAGQPWTATLEPFIPAVQAGQDMGQRMWPRRIARFQAYVTNSSGFAFERLYSGQSGALLPAAGTVMKRRRIETWNQGEDPTQPPTLREQSYLDRPIGRSHDPREAIVKDTPGPLTVIEIATEVTL